MATNEKFSDLTEFFNIKKLPQHRTIISADGEALSPVSPYYASNVLDISIRALEEGDTRPSRTTKGHDCYVTYFEPQNTKSSDWSQTQIALIEDRGISGLHMAFVELSSIDGHKPNTPNLKGLTFSASAIVTPPSNALRELLYPVHNRDFDDDGFFDLSISLHAREGFFQKVNECAGKIPLTRPEEFASDSMQYTGEQALTASVSQKIREIQDRVTAQSASDHLRAITLQSVCPL